MTATTRRLAQEALDAMFPSLPLFMQTAPHNGTRTSVDAAHDIKPHVSRLRAEVLLFLVIREALEQRILDVEAERRANELADQESQERAS